MSHNEKSPHQSPVHDTRESQPGLDSLAPSDGSHRPTPETTPPGAQPTAPGSLKAPETANDKLTALDAFRKGSENYALTTNQGVRIADDQNSLRAGSRGPTLLEDFILREKITHFDHERIPERIVHARGSAAHGYFQPYKDLSDITKAAFLCDPQKITPGLCSLFDSTGRRGIC
ncbi:catalase HPII [Salmonella enterica subsp. enterica]|nr:catalase HPII [Salmonella enterica subsp. enterica]